LYFFIGVQACVVGLFDVKKKEARLAKTDQLKVGILFIAQFFQSQLLTFLPR